jgi:hypothetical protein
MNESTGPRKLGGSASVAGDQIAVSKESSLTGEVYVRADGKKGKLSDEDYELENFFAPPVLISIFLFFSPDDSTPCRKTINCGHCCN